MRMRLRTAALLTTAGALVAGVITPIAWAKPGTATTGAPAGISWRVDLDAGEAAGIDVRAGHARLDRWKAFVAPVDVNSSPPRGGAEGYGVPTGFLTLPERQLSAATDRVDIALAGTVPAGSTASVDVRGMRASGTWSEWTPAAPRGPLAGTATLPEATSQVQARLVLTGAGRAAPAVDAMTLTAQPSGRTVAKAAAATVPLRYSVFATREGLVGGTTANGHVITKRDHFVALPSRRALSPKGTGDYSVRVCAPNKRCAFAPVWDVGPWNTRDDYWNPSSRRQQWGNLPQGVPEAQAAFRSGYNGGKDQYGRKVANPAGIDLGDGTFWDALGLRNNAQVTVDYLWTGSAPLAKVAGRAPVNLVAAPRVGAKVVGMAAAFSSVPVVCRAKVGARAWVKVGDDQYIDAVAVPSAGTARACPAASPAARR